jgi:hypothetical protein
MDGERRLAVHPGHVERFGAEAPAIENAIAMPPVVIAWSQ